MTPTLQLSQLRDRYRHELFDVVLPFWDRHGIDHQFGGFLCGLDHDGKLVHSDKFHWYMGRGLWVYSFLYNHFGRDPHHLEIARKAKEFWLRFGPQPDGWWAETLRRDGRVARPFSGDVYGMYFTAEGLQEYAFAAGDEQALGMATAVMKQLFQYAGTLEVRPQGMWMVSLRIATQMLRRWDDPALNAIADYALDAIVNRHYNPDIGLNNEVLTRSFERPQEEATKCQLGHSIETLWMVMDEAGRRGDSSLRDTAIARIRHHLHVGWDHIHGGIAEWINVDQGGYAWPEENPIGTDLAFRMVGEYNYVKSLWSLNEILIAMLMIFRETKAGWAAEWFETVQKTIDEKFSLKRYGYPLWLLFTGRKITFQPHTARQDNYHQVRQLMLCLLIVEEMLAGSRGTA